MSFREDADWMRRAWTLARCAWGMTSPNPMVGAVLVRDGVSIGEGYHHQAGLPHAEVEALRSVQGSADDATMYVTLEPCSTTGRTPPCTRAILDAGVRRVVIGSLDPNPAHAGRGVEILRAGGVDVEYGVEEALCADLNRAFFSWITKGKPWVLLKMAMTLDGKIATQSGESKWITGPAARGRVQELRRWADAVMVSAETVRLDRPSLTVREPADWPRQPRKIVACRRTSPEEIAGFFPGEPVRCVILDDAAAWEVFLKELGGEGVTSLLLEGGGELAASALRCNAVDEVEFHIAPRLLGGRGSRPVLGGEDPARLAEALRLRDVQTVLYGDDLAVSGRIEKR